MVEPRAAVGATAASDRVTGCMEAILLQEVSCVKGYAVLGVDGHLGTVVDLLFDDTTWKLRWLVANTRQWFPSHEVLLPVSVWGHPDSARRQFTVKLTMQQIQDSLGADRARPVSQQQEVDLGAGPADTFGAIDASTESPDPHLRSMEAVLGHRVNAVDEVIGHVDELLVEDADWSIRYLKVDTRDWRRDSRVLIPPRSIRAIDWQERLVHLHVDRQKIASTPPYGPVPTIAKSDAGVLPVHWGIKWIKA